MTIGDRVLPPGLLFCYHVGSLIERAIKMVEKNIYSAKRAIERLEAAPEKRKTGCPKGTVKSKMAKALIETNSAVKNVETILSSMNDRDRKLFVALTSGDDELKALLKVGHKHGITTIARIVYTKDGKAFETKRVNSKNVDDLDDFSYQRLLRIAKSEVKNLIGKTDYSPFLTDITDLFRLIAPDQVSVLAKISMNDKAKDSDRIRAANSILDRAGYESAEDKKKKEKVNMPVQVNILVGGKPQPEDNPIIQVQSDE